LCVSSGVFLNLTACRVAAVQEELPAAVDELPAARPKARQLLARRGRAHHHAALSSGKQVGVIPSRDIRSC
jgi:hypothetical protein